MRVRTSPRRGHRLLSVALIAGGVILGSNLPMGAQGNGAIYTQYGHMVHIIRKVILRVGTKLDLLVLKLH